MLIDPSIESNDVLLLSEEMLSTFDRFRRACSLQPIGYRIGCTLRGPLVQARMWCRSRTREEVAERRSMIEQQAPKLAAMLRPEFACLGPQVTTHLPGQSWHNWGAAVDIAACVGGRLWWDGSAAKKLAMIAKEAGLHHYYFEAMWNRTGRAWHMQLSKHETPLQIRGLADSWADVEAEMARRFDI